LTGLVPTYLRYLSWYEAAAPPPSGRWLKEGRVRRCGESSRSRFGGPAHSPAASIAAVTRNICGDRRFLPPALGGENLVHRPRRCALIPTFGAFVRGESRDGNRGAHFMCFRACPEESLLSSFPRILTFPPGHLAVKPMIIKDGAHGGRKLDYTLKARIGTGPHPRGAQRILYQEAQASATRASPWATRLRKSTESIGGGRARLPGSTRRRMAN
jgi:hypothetical protein